MPKKNSTPDNPYAKLCEAVHEKGGKIRLARSGDAFMLVVEDLTEERCPRVAGYAFPTIAELDAHSLLMLKWLRRRDSRPQNGEGVVGA